MILEIINWINLDQTKLKYINYTESNKFKLLLDYAENMKCFATSFLF
jgi:hypothetical protein